MACPSVSNGKTKKGAKWIRIKDAKDDKSLNVRKDNGKNAKTNAHRWIIASLEEKLEREKLKQEKSSELIEEIEKCLLIQTLKGNFLECLSDLRSKH
jgi:hypothetical protein